MERVCTEQPLRVVPQKVINGEAEFADPVEEGVVERREPASVSLGSKVTRLRERGAGAQNERDPYPSSLSNRRHEACDAQVRGGSVDEAPAFLARGCIDRELALQPGFCFG